MSFTFGAGNNNNNNPGPAPAAPNPFGNSGGTTGPSTTQPPPSVAPASGFQFGNTAAPAATGGFSFGNTSTASTPAAPPASNPASSTSTTAPTPAPSTNNSFTNNNIFGNNNNTSAPPPASTTTPAPAPAQGFSFNASAPSATTPGPSTNASTTAATAAAPTPGQTPATGAASGFSFATNAASGTSTSGSAPAPSTGGFGFNTAGATQAPTTTAFSSSTPTPAAPLAAPVAPPAEQPTLEAPEFDVVFSELEVWSQIKRLCTQEDTLMAGQELVHCVQSNLKDLKPQILEWTLPNQSLRQQLGAKPIVSVHKGGTTSLSKKVFDRIIDLSNDLHISEAMATTLYAQVSQDLEAIQSIPMGNLIDRGMGPNKKYAITTKVAREFFFYVRHLRLQTLLYMLQSRLKDDSANSPIIQATDLLMENGLVSDLIKMVRDYTARIQQLHGEIRPPPVVPAYGNPPQPESSTPNFRKVHLLFASQERYVACECLFFIAYHIQLTPSEMAGLLDLIKDLSALETKPSPFTNVPSPYEPASVSATIPTAWPTGPTPAAPFSYALKEKDRLGWQREFATSTFESGVPQILQCISLLAVSAIAAMETRHVLYDRKLHGPNAFGSGNAFLPPDDLSLDGIREIHARLNHDYDAVASWGTRDDIWSILAGAYALLLRSASILMSSPRTGGHSQLMSEVRKAARFCLERPVDSMGITFSRLSLIPILQRLPDPTEQSFCNTKEFGLAVFGEFYSGYVNALAERGLPVSRLRWEKEQDEDLKLRRAQQASARATAMQVGAPINRGGQDEVIPASVNLMERPDCLDDVVALASTLCSLGSDYSRKFWSTDSNGNIQPSRFLLDVERMLKKEDSLTPSYISFLAAISNDDQSASAVHVLLSRTPEVSADAAVAVPPINWTTLVSDLRWYAQELSPFDSDVVTKPSSSSITASSSKNSDYYYNLDGQDMPSSYTSTTTTFSQRDSTSTSTRSKAKELSTSANFRVASHLAVIMNVALHSATAQHDILSTSIPIGEGVAAGKDEALLVLFKLAIAPLSPQLRGQTLSTIASLLRPLELEDKEKEKLVLEQAKSAWEYLEACPLLPIALLDQYHVSNGNSLNENVGLAFPPSSISLASSINPPLESSLPKEPRYGLIYAMEHIESRMGWYPSAEGFLQMLRSLVCTAGCPSKLGQRYRARSGCAPYVEFVIDFVLPRALGIRGSPRLPFRTYGDQSRLVANAMSVIEAVVVRYSVPCDALKIKDQTSAASLLGIQSVVDRIVVPDSNADPQESANDFRNLSISTLRLTDAADGTSTTLASRSSASDIKVPSVKSPGFAIVADILSSKGGVIFQAIGTVLTEHGGPDATDIYGLQSDMMDVAYATFGATPPDLSSAKEGVKDESNASMLQSLLKPLLPRAHNAILDQNELGDARFWREKSVVLALRILCAAATREHAFEAAVLTSKTPLKIVPVLRFQTIRSNSSNLASWDVSVLKISKLLFSMNHSALIRKSLVQYIGYNTATEGNSSLSATSVSLFSFLHQTMSPNYSLQELCGNDPVTSLAKAVAQRLVVSSKDPYSASDTQTTEFILNWILQDLREGIVCRDGLMQVLLGLPTEISDGNWTPGARKYSGSIIDCFDAILEILKGTDESGAGVASSCFEVLFRLYDLLKTNTKLSGRIALYTAERLRSVQFWRSNTLLLLSARGNPSLSNASKARNLEEANPDVLHCVSWLLKGLACEIQMLAGFTNGSSVEESSVMAGLLAPRPIECNELLTLFFGPEEGIAQRLVELAPIEKSSIDSGLRHPPVEALRAGAVALPGPFDVVSGYQRLDSKKVLKNITTKYCAEDLDSMRLWSEQYSAVSAWNCAVSHLCQGFYNMIDASLLSSDSLKLCSAGGPGFDAVGLHANGITSLLMIIVDRIIENASDAAHHGMDSILIPAATCSLGNAALILADSITRLDYQDAPTAGELLAVATSLSKALAFSAIGEDSAEEAPTRYERTTVLGTALSALLGSAVASEPDLTRQFRRSFINAIHALEKLAVFKVDSEVSESNSVVAILARSCIGGIIDACSDEEVDSADHSFVWSAISKNFIKCCMQNVKSLDEHICSLLYTIALQPFGSNLLIDEGICQYLQSAANAYLVEEGRVEVSLRDGASGYAKSTIRTPGFLKGHLKLMSSLMSSAIYQPQRMSDMALELLKTFALYNRVVKRLCHNFPAEADVLRWFLRCFVQAASLAQPINSHDRHELLNKNGSQAKHIFTESRLLESGIAMLCQQLWENPLPKELLPSVPHSLEETDSKQRSNVVTVEKHNGQTWWNVLDQILAAHVTQNKYDFGAPAVRNDFGTFSGQQNQTRWTEHKFEYSIAAIDVLSLGITLLKRMDRYDLIDNLSAARGLFKCGFAAESIGNRIEAVEFQAENRGSLMDTSDAAVTSGNEELEMEYLRLFGKSMAHCVEDLLVVAYTLSADSKENGEDGNAVGSAIRTAIEQTGIDTKGVGCLSLFDDDESRKKLVSTLCTRIKKETKC